MPFPAGDGYGEIRAQDLTQAARIALLRGDQLGVVIDVHRQGLLWTEGDADIAVLAPIMIENNLVSRFFLQGGGSFAAPFSLVASRHLISVSPVFVAMVTHCHSATKGATLRGRVGAKSLLLPPPDEVMCPAPLVGLRSIAAGRMRVVDLPRIDKPRPHQKGMPKNAPAKALGGARNAE